MHYADEVRRINLAGGFLLGLGVGIGLGIALLPDAPPARTRIGRSAARIERNTRRRVRRARRQSGVTALSESR